MRLPRPSVKLLLVLFPFVLPAVAINLFLLFLLLQAVGVSALAPIHALLAAIPLSLPATYAAAVWVKSLIDQAGG